MKAIDQTKRALALAGLVTLASCASPPAPAPAPPPVPVPTHAVPPPLPKPPVDWRDAPQSAGDWRWAMIDSRSTASFVVPGGSARVTIACDRFNARVLIARQGMASAAVPMALTSTFGTRPLMSDPLRSPPGWVVAELHAADPMLDSIAFSRGRFMLEVAGLETLYLPAWPEIGRVVEDCR